MSDLRAYLDASPETVAGAPPVPDHDGVGPLLVMELRPGVPGGRGPVVVGFVEDCYSEDAPPADRCVAAVYGHVFGAFDRRDVRRHAPLRLAEPNLPPDRPRPGRLIDLDQG